MEPTQEVRCNCGEWEWREVSLFTGLAATERFCPRCKRKSLLVYRGRFLVAAVPFGGGHEMPIEQALRQAGCNEQEVSLLLDVARLMTAS